MINENKPNEIYKTGAVRDTDAGKPRPDLISPFAIERLAMWLAQGAEKYEPRNWEKGIPISRCVASLERHLMKMKQGDESEDHVAAIMCNGMFIAHFQEMINRGVLPAELDDLPRYRLTDDEKEELCK